MKSKMKSTEALRARHRRLAELLGKIGWVLRGTITERIDKRAKGKIGGKPRVWGPYYQWTFKRQGKTVTVNLSASQAKVYRKAIANQRKADKILQQMRAISLEFLEAATVSPKRRKVFT